MSTIRVALFVCDVPLAAVVEKDGDYPVIFNELLRQSLSLADSSASFILDSYDVREKMEYPKDIDEYQGIIMTGSAASAYENLEWINQLVAYIASLAEEKPHIKLIGICFGHQILGRALGKDCVPNGGKWEVGLTQLDLTDTGKKIFGTDTLNVQEMHRDHVPEVPSACRLLASTPVAMNQGFIRYPPHHPLPDSVSDISLKDIQIFTVQGHPEFTKSIVDTIVDAREAAGVFDKATAEGARERSTWRNDGVSVIAKVIWGVLGVAPETS